jgi:hypothetical protein
MLGKIQSFHPRQPGHHRPRRNQSGGVSRSQDIPKTSVADILKVNAAQHEAAL